MGIPITPIGQHKFKNSSKYLMTDDAFNELKEKGLPVHYYTLKGRTYNKIPDKEEMERFNDYFNCTNRFHFEYIWQIPFPLYLHGPVSYFHIEERDVEIDDDNFPTWIPLESRERKVFYAQGKGIVYINIHWFSLTIGKQFNNKNTTLKEIKHEL